MEAIMPSITQLIVALLLLVVGPIGGALAQSTVEGRPVTAQDTVFGEHESPHLDRKGSLNDHQQLRTYFLNGSRDRLR
jgi:hypothetical protein